MEIRTIELEGTLVLHLNNHHIRITPLTNPESNVIKFGIEAPSEVSVHREEIYKKKKVRGELNVSYKNLMGYPQKIQALFTELILIKHKSEKLEHAAKELFERDKIITPKTLASIASGEKSTTSWVITCAIDVLLRENAKSLKLILSSAELYRNWAKPLLQRGIAKTTLLETARRLSDPDFDEWIICHHQSAGTPQSLDSM